MLTERATRLGKVFELDGESDALATRTCHCRDITLDVAYQLRFGEESFFGQNGLVLDALRIPRNNGRIFSCGTADG